MLPHAQLVSGHAGANQSAASSCLSCDSRRRYSMQNAPPSQPPTPPQPPPLVLYSQHSFPHQHYSHYRARQQQLSTKTASATSSHTLMDDHLMMDPDRIDQHLDAQYIDEEEMEEEDCGEDDDDDDEDLEGARRTMMTRKKLSGGGGCMRVPSLASAENSECSCGASLPPIPPHPPPPPNNFDSPLPPPIGYQTLSSYSPPLGGNDNGGGGGGDDSSTYSLSMNSASYSCGHSGPPPVMLDAKLGQPGRKDSKDSNSHSSNRSSAGNDQVSVDVDGGTPPTTTAAANAQPPAEVARGTSREASAAASSSSNATIKV